ncbi:androgen-dependent TFPI-regulating protein-like isoform X1 [Cloeon dipterum]|uniref:androgen-dependent TFPI-regulating protein-like isoform X1 n=2 Tax=Cloeon dipterum TaxID=197152 RepID=UPI00321FC0B5
MIYPAGHFSHGFVSGLLEHITTSKMSSKTDGIKHHCVTFFHGSVVTYYAIVDFHMAQANYNLYQSDHPITKMFLCGVLHFFTTWNQVFHQLYFLLSLVQDLLTYSTNRDHLQFCSWFDSIKYKYFVPILMPATFMTMVNYWTIHLIAPHLMLAELLQFYAPWLNHAVHTFITPIILGEFFITTHGIPSWRKGFKYSTILMACYAGWVYPFGFLLGQWPYPFLEVMNATHHILFFPSMFIHGYFWYIVFRYAEKQLYGEYASTSAATNGKKKD